MDMNKNVITNVTVCGAGVQGSMLAFRFAIYNKKVSLYDVKKEIMVESLEKIIGWLNDYVQEGKLTRQQAQDALGHIYIQNDLSESLKDADFVIENVPERIELKQKVWAEIDKAAPGKTLLTTNSSSLRSSEIGIHVKRKDKTFNLNFMTPVKDDLVEVMWNDRTSEETKQAVIQLLESIKCVPVVTKKEIKGFSLNRVWRMMKKECLKLWAEGYIEPEDLDRAFMLEWNTDHGPFGLMDKVGLDVVRDIELSYYRESGDDADKPPKALEELIAQGLLGEKSGAGFYTYPDPAYAKAGWLHKEKE
jgi:3-hydroxybutyryl-CoA dehydrogenase